MSLPAISIVWMLAVILSIRLFTSSPVMRLTTESHAELQLSSRRGESFEPPGKRGDKAAERAESVPPFDRVDSLAFSLALVRLLIARTSSSLEARWLDDVRGDGCTMPPDIARLELRTDGTLEAAARVCASSVRRSSISDSRLRDEICSSKSFTRRSRLPGVTFDVPSFNCSRALLRFADNSAFVPAEASEGLGLNDSFGTSV